MLEVKGLNQFYGESHTLWDIDVTVSQGERLCLMGRNGVGKSTLLKCIMGLEPIRQGEISFAGQKMAKQPCEARARHGIGYVPQGREIFPRLTVAENLATGLGIRGKSSRIPELVFDLFPVLGEMMSRRGGDLSGGQQQQLAIGRALVPEPELLILDEPTEGIQPNVVQEIGDVILRLNEEHGMTVVLVEQKLPFARRIGQSFLILDKGRRVAAGEMAALDDATVAKYLTV